VDPTFTEELVALLPRLRRFARALSRSVEETDDLVQEACERALARADQFAPGTRLDSWLFRILQNRWLDRCRQRGTSSREVPVEEAFDLAGSDGRTTGETRILMRRPREALESLPAEQRLVLVAVCVEGLSNREAAEMLEVPIGTMMSRLARARARLHELVLDEEERPVDVARR
jgi:RNA polymerase sigma-70 factor (ECF subfamily)